jgi:hypothetical protein
MLGQESERVIQPVSQPVYAHTGKREGCVEVDSATHLLLCRLANVTLEFLCLLVQLAFLTLDPPAAQQTTSARVSANGKEEK